MATTVKQRNPRVSAAAKLFTQICREVDALAADEATMALPENHSPTKAASRWQDLANQAREKLKGFPGTQVAKRKAMVLGLLLSEIGKAESPEHVSERFHARRDEVEALLQELA